MKKIVITTKAMAKATNMPKGAIIDYNDAPEWMQKHYDNIHAPISAEMAAKLEAQNKADLAFAKKIRDRVAEGMLPF